MSVLHYIGKRFIDFIQLAGACTIAWQFASALGPMLHLDIESLEITPTIFFALMFARVVGFGVRDYWRSQRNDGDNAVDLSE